MNIQTYHHRAAKKFNELQKIFPNQITMESDSVGWKLIIGGYVKETIISGEYLNTDTFIEAEHSLWWWQSTVRGIKKMISEGKTIIAK
jgi:hypothetical protein